ncbi:hypothetical protein F5141DRAFT_992485, partial [Pisolithus sp. B1]
LKKDWNSPVYGFFAPEPSIKYVGGHCSHIFQCTAKGCGKGVHQFLDKADAHSTGNMQKHVKLCWGEDVLHEIMEAKNAHVAHEAVKHYKKNGSISFEQKNKNILTSSIPNCRHNTNIQNRVEICLMKTGRPDYYIPDATTISWSTHSLQQVQQKLAEKLQRNLKTYEGKLNFATDAWTSPNHRSFVVITVHLEENGKLQNFPLNVVKV